jgi:phage/plasmid-like protein (TIGR03299 family)
LSEETPEWLNNMTLIGFTEKRGNAWHYKEEMQGIEPNHYPSAIPPEDVERRLFNFVLESSPVFQKVYGPTEDADFYGYPVNVDPDGSTYYMRPVDNYQIISTSDTHDVMNIPRGGYQIHQYNEWLTDSVKRVLRDELQIGSAGLLKNKAVAWVQVEMPDSRETKDGVVYRPYLTASTASNGLLRTMYQLNCGLVVCDNTLAGALAENSERFSVKHSKNSSLLIEDAREALGILNEAADEFEFQIDFLNSVAVSDKEWDSIVNRLVPIPEDEGRGQTVAMNKQDDIRAIYRSDARVTPWTGTAFGALQAWNTWNTHFRGVDKARVQRNQFNVLNGKSAEFDLDVIDTIRAVVS